MSKRWPYWRENELAPNDVLRPHPGHNKSVATVATNASFSVHDMNRLWTKVSLATRHGLLGYYSARNTTQTVVCVHFANIDDKDTIEAMLKFWGAHEVQHNHEGQFGPDVVTNDDDMIRLSQQE